MEYILKNKDTDKPIAKVIINGTDFQIVCKDKLDSESISYWLSGIEHQWYIKHRLLRGRGNEVSEEFLAKSLRHIPQLVPSWKAEEVKGNK